jgi:hypothetical protein
MSEFDPGIHYFKEGRASARPFLVSKRCKTGPVQARRILASRKLTRELRILFHADAEQSRAMITSIAE